MFKRLQIKWESWEVRKKPLNTQSELPRKVITDIEQHGCTVAPDAQTGGRNHSLYHNCHYYPRYTVLLQLLLQSVLLLPRAKHYYVAAKVT